MSIDRLRAAPFPASVQERPGDAQAFAEAMLAVAGLQQQAWTRPSAPMTDRMSAAVASTRQATADSLAEAVRAHNSTDLLLIARDLQDQSVQNDLFAKVTGKTVSAIDQLTKLT